MKRLFAGMLMLPSLLGGCASIFSGSGPQTISIMTEPANADISIVNNRSGDVVLKTKSPFIAVLERKDGEFKEATYKVLLTMPGYVKEEVPINSSISGWFWGNILFGGIVGCAIDIGTGAVHSLNDKPIKVKLYPNSLEGMAERDEAKNEDLELLKQYGTRMAAKRALIKKLRVECPGFTPTSEMREHAECREKYRSFMSVAQQ